MKSTELSLSLPIEVQNIDKMTEKVEELLSTLKKANSLVDELAELDIKILVGKKN